MTKPPPFFSSCSFTTIHRAVRTGPSECRLLQTLVVQWPSSPSTFHKLFFCCFVPCGKNWSGSLHFSKAVRLSVYAMSSQFVLVNADVWHTLAAQWPSLPHFSQDVHLSLYALWSDPIKRNMSQLLKMRTIKLVHVMWCNTKQYLWSTYTQHEPESYNMKRSKADLREQTNSTSTDYINKHTATLHPKSVSIKMFNNQSFTFIS